MIDQKYCDKCGLCAKAATPCLSEPYEEGIGGLLVITDYPSLSDEVGGTLLKSSREKLFWNVLKDVVEGDDKRVTVTYALKCGGHDNKFTKKQLLHCTDKYLFAEIKRIKPDTILLLGKTPMQALGFAGSISELRGSINDYQFLNADGTVAHNTKVVVTYTPGYVQFNIHRDPDLLTKFADDIHRAYRGQFDSQKEVTQHVPVTTIAQVKEVIKYILHTKVCSFDFETTKLDNIKDTRSAEFYATLLSVSFQHGSAYTIPLFHYESPFTPKQVMFIFHLFNKYVWGNPDIRKVGHNVKFDCHVAARYVPDIVFRGRFDDTMVMHHLLDENLRHGLKVILPVYYPEFAGWEMNVKGIDWAKIPLDTLGKYAAVDSDGTLRLCTILEQQLRKDERVYNVYRNYSMLALKVLFRIEQRGLLVDRANIIKYIERATELLAEQEQLLRDYKQIRKFELIAREDAKERYIEKLILHMDTLKTDKGKDKTREKIQAVKVGTIDPYKGINFGSSKQLIPLLYESYGFGFKKPPVKFNKKKGKSDELTGKNTLKGFNDTTGFIKDLLVWRGIRTNLTTFLKGFLNRMDDNDRVHSSYSLSRVVTHRLASKNPNLQNISTHVKIDSDKVKEVVAMVKKSIVPPARHVLMTIDYSQLELRLVADIANEPTMIEAYQQNKDLHKITGAKLMKLTYEEFEDLPDDEKGKGRTNAKPANFGLIYGQEAPGYMQYANDNYGVKMALKEAEETRKAFFALYAALPVYFETYKARAKRFGYVRNMFGLKRNLPNIHSKDEYLRAQDERYAVNAPVQGTGGIMTMLSMCLLEARLPSSVGVVNSVHDSIQLYVPYELIPYTAKIVRDTMCNLPMKEFFGRAIEKVPLAVDIEISNVSWKDVVAYDEIANQVIVNKQPVPLSDYLCIPENSFKK